MAVLAAQCVAQGVAPNGSVATSPSIAQSVPAAPAPYRKLIHMHHTSWGERDGLPISGVNRIYRTSDGYLWLGTIDALIRFDGVRFVRFDGSNVAELKSQTVGPLMPLLIDKAGTFWIGRPDGALISYRDRRFREVLPADSVRARITRLVEVADGTLWGIARKLFVLRNGVVDSAPVPKELQTGILGIHRDGKGGIWIGTSRGTLWQWNQRTLKQLHFRLTAGEPVRVIAAPPDGSVWFLHMGVSRIDSVRETSIHAPGATENMNGTAAAIMADGSIIVSTRGRGLVRWNNGVIDAFSEAEGLSDASVRDVYVDADGSIWAATDAGLDRLRVAPFVTLNERDGVRLTSPSAVVATADGSVWSKTSGQLELYRMHGGIVANPRGHLYGDLRVDTISLPESASLRYALHSDAGATGVLLSGFGQQMLVYDRNRLIVARRPSSTRGIVQATIVDSTGAIWIAASPDGVSVLRKGIERLIPESGMPVERTGMGLAIDVNGDLWSSTASPAALLRIHHDSVVERIPFPNGTSSAAGRPVIEGRDTVWSTLGGSLVRVVAHRAARIDVPAIDPIIRNASMVMLIANKYLWVASGNGIARMKLGELHALADGRTAQQPIVQQFSTLDGLISAKLTGTNRPAGTKAPDGRLWFATPAGLAVVDPDAIEDADPTPTVHIEETLVSGKEFLPRDNVLEIPAHADRVEIHFTATGLLMPERVRLQYRMDGSDNAWVNVGNVRTATYTRLGHGRYRFRVRAWNEGMQPGPESVMQLRVLPMWYEAAWFAPLAVLLLAAAGSTLVYASFRTKTRIVADKMRARFEAESAERARLARELHDTLLQGFTGITLQLQAVRQSVVQSPEHAQAALDRILTTADVSLREARTMVWDMRAPELDNHTLADAVREILTSTIGEAPIGAQFCVSGNERKLPLGIETAILRVAREAIANTVKHAAANRVDIRIDYGERLITLTISDNGTGFEEKLLDAKANGGHWGLKGMHERASRARGELRVRSTPGGGTTVELILPTAHAE